MNKRIVSFWMVVRLVLLSALLLAGCGSRTGVGALRTESQSVELGDAESVRVEIDFSAGDLEVTGGAPERPRAVAPASSNRSTLTTRSRTGPPSSL